MAVNLTSGAISKISSDACTSKDLKPVLQLIYGDRRRTRTIEIEHKQWCLVKLSDGSFWQYGCIPFEFYTSNKLRIGFIVQLNIFQLTKLFRKSGVILGLNLTVIQSKCGIPLIGDPKQYYLNETPLVVTTTTPTIPDEDHANSHLVGEPPTSKQKQDHVDSLLNENIDDSRVVYLTSGAISKIMTGKCTENDLKPVLQVTYINSCLIPTGNGEQCYIVLLSDGSYRKFGLIPDDIFISNKLQKGSILQLTKFRLYDDIKGEDISISIILVSDLIVIHRKCGINIGDLEPLPENETAIVENRIMVVLDEDHANSHHVEEPPTSKQKQDHVDFFLNEDIDDVEEPPTSIQKLSTSTQKCSSHSPTLKQKQDRVAPGINENIDDSHHVEEPSPSIQIPSTSTQKCSSGSPTQSKKRKVQPSDDAISVFGKDISETGINLTSGAITEIVTGKFTQNDLKPVLQLIDVYSGSGPSKDDKQWYLVVLSDGSFWQFGHIADEIFLSKNLQIGSIVQLTKFQLTKFTTGELRYISVCDLSVICSKCEIIGNPAIIHGNETHLMEKSVLPISDHARVDPDMDHANSHHDEEPPTSKQKQDHVDSLLNEDIDDVKEPPTSIQNPLTSTQKCSSHSPTLKQRWDRDDSHLNENINDSRHVEEPPTSKQNPSASTQERSFHSLTQNKTNTIIGVNLTPGAITKIMTDKCSSTDLKPVVQVTNILSGRISNKNDKQCYRKVVLSDGSSSHFGCIADDIFISNNLQKGFILRLTKFHFTKYCGNIRVLLINDVNVIHSKCDIIVNPEPFPRNDIPLVERSTPPVTVDEDHVDISRAQESMTSTQNCSETQSRKRKHQSSNEHPEPETNEDVDNSHSSQELSATTQRCSSHSQTQSKKRKHRSGNNSISKVVSKRVRMLIEKNKEDDVGSCFKKLETLEKDISIMARTMMEKNKEVDGGFKKLDALKEDVSKMTRMMIEKSKEDDVGACCKRLGVIEEDVSKLTRMVMEKIKDNDVGACFKKLQTLEEDVSVLTRMMMDKNKDDVVGLKKLETLEDDVTKLTKLMIEKNKEDDMGACIEKLDKMGWGAEEPMYETALLLFGQSADYRKLWLHLKPECCGKWVKNAGNMFGLLD